MENNLLIKNKIKNVVNVTLIPSGSTYHEGRIVDISGDSSYNDGRIVVAMNGDSASSRWILIEFVMTLVQIVAASVALMTPTDDEEDRGYIFLSMIISYTSVSIANLPILCWRFWRNSQIFILELRNERMMNIMKSLEKFRNAPKYIFVGWAVSLLWNSIGGLLSLGYTTKSFWLCWAFFVIIFIRHVRPNLDDRVMYIVFALVAPLGDILIKFYYDFIYNGPLPIMLFSCFFMSTIMVLFEVVIVKVKAVDLGSNNFLISHPRLKGPNYNEWASNLRKALEATNKFGYVDGTIPYPGVHSDDLDDWWSNNDLAFSWMKLTIVDEVLSNFSDLEVASKLWDDIRLRYLVENGQHVQRIKEELATCSQHGMTIQFYYENFMQLWNSLAEFRVSKICDCSIGINLQKEREEDCLHEFLKGLDESVYGPFKYHLLSRVPLPNVGEAYRLLLSSRFPDGSNMMRARSCPPLGDRPFSFTTSSV